MIKLFCLTLLMLLSISCSTEVTSERVDSREGMSEQALTEQTRLNKVHEALTLAVKNKDYRLLITSGRSKSIPGIRASDYQGVVKLCGEKYMPATGDVLTSKAQRTARKKALEYMKRYNEETVQLCQKKFL